MSIHILQLGPYPPPEGGITRNMLAIRERLRERGDRCSIVATSRSTKVVDEPDVHHPRSAMEAVKLLRSINHDVLHLHVGGEITRRVLSLAVAAATFGKNPVLTIHSGGYPKTAEGQNAKPNSARGRIFRQFSRIVAVNDELADVFRKYGVTDEHLSVILPFALTPSHPPIELRDDLAAFCDTHSPLLVSVGGLEPDYEPLFLIEAMRSILDGHPNAGLVIVGDGSMKNDVETAIAASGYGDAICLAGDIPHAETLHLIAKADAMLRITLFDGDAISVREALFVGTPVIATDNGMRPMGVRLVNRADAKGLLREITDVAEHPAKRPEHLVPDHSNIDKVLDLYDSLL